LSDGNPRTVSAIYKVRACSYRLGTRSTRRRGEIQTHLSFLPRLSFVTSVLLHRYSFIAPRQTQWPTLKQSSLKVVSRQSTMAAQPTIPSSSVCSSSPWAQAQMESNDSDLSGVTSETTYSLCWRLNSIIWSTRTNSREAALFV